MLWWRISKDGESFTSSAHYGRRSFALKAGREIFQGKEFYIAHGRIGDNTQFLARIIEKISPLPPSCFKSRNLNIV